MTRITCILSLLLLSSSVSAQNLVYNQGSIHILPNAIVQINGGIENDGATTVFENNGTVTVANSNNFPVGDFMIDNAGKVSKVI